MPPIRRLPVLQNTETTDPERPPWHWIIIGFSFIVSLFAPLAMLATWIGQRVAVAFFGDATSGELALRLAAASRGARFAMWLAAVGAPVLAYIFSCFGAGTLVGRFGARAGPREAAGAGGVAGLTLWALVFLRGSEASPGVATSAAPGAAARGCGPGGARLARRSDQLRWRAPRFSPSYCERDANHAAPLSG